jgi:LPS-assembly protein
MLDPRRPLPLLLTLCLALPAAAQEPVVPAPPTLPTATPPPAATTPQATTTLPAASTPPPNSTAPAVPPGAPAAPGTPPVVPGQPPAPPAGPPGAGPGRIDFQLKFPPDKTGKAGGNAAGSAVTLEYKRDDYAVLAGGVKLRYQDIELQADEAEIDLKTRVVTARGNVVLDQGPRRLIGETLDFDLDTKTGKVTHATAFVSPDYYFTGVEVEKIDDDTYTVLDGVFTSCSQKVPDWSFRLARAQVELGGYARMHHASMRVKRLPVFYTPYILWPAKSERSSGLLIPKIGYSQRRGASLGLAYFQTLGRSYDTTLHLDGYTEGFLGIGNELRYRPTAGTHGDLLGYMIKDPESPDHPWRWKVEWNHLTEDLPFGMRAGINYQNYSDFNFFRDFEHDFDRSALRFIDSRAFVTGNWGPHLLNLLLNDRETFVSQGQTVVQRKLPELEYRLRSTQLWRTPLYLQFLGSSSFLDVERPGSYSGSYGRFDLFPQLTLPVRTFPWLSLSLTGGERLTWYGNSLAEATQQFAGQSLTRTFPVAGAEIVGPSFSRIFTAWGTKIKHVIEPRWTYNFQGDPGDPQRVPLFDEVDIQNSTNSGTLALINRVLAKPKDGLGSAREVFLFQLSRSFSFDPSQPLQTSLDGQVKTTSGPYDALLRWTPSEKASLKAEVLYDTLFHGISSTSLSSDVRFGAGNFAGLTWFTRYRPEIHAALGNQVRFNGGISVLPNRLRVEGQINYDVQQKLLQQQRYIVDWLSQCYGLRLELRDFRTGTGPQVVDREFRFSLTLRNVGTFLDLTSRSTTAAP